MTAEAFFKDGKKPSAAETMVFFSARTFAYDFLKCTFRQAPSKKFIRFLIEREIVQAFPFYDSGSDLAKAVDVICAYLNRVDPSSEKALHPLDRDFTRLFIGPGEAKAPPWESIYRDAERLHFSKETLLARDAYRKYHLLPRRLGRDPDDHLGLELDFMHKLCELTLEKTEAPDRAGRLGILADQKSFLENHLLKWVPAWSTDVVKSAETGFYRGAAQLLEAYLKTDRKWLEAFLAAA